VGIHAFGERPDPGAVTLWAFYEFRTCEREARPTLGAGALPSARGANAFGVPLLARFGILGR
jgi:hypothetical protein